jgi:tartrate-resistant acid phosphatase type 5
MIDTTLCYGIWSDPVHDAMCAAQLVWLEAALNSSKADYLFVAGHYPVWSGCSHGNTEWAIDVLLPLMLNSNATGYISGHDHCLQHIVPNESDIANGGGLVFIVSGAGDGCCYEESNVNSLPQDSLKFILSSGVNPNNTTGGFASFDFIQSSSNMAAKAAKSTLVVSYLDQDGNTLFSSQPIQPRV